MVPPKDPRQLAAAIIEMAKSADERKRLGENGRAMVQTEFDPLSLTKEVEATFLRLVSENRTKNMAA